jgi:biopolymer transport protein ExbB
MEAAILLALVLTSVISITFIIERAFALRTGKVIPRGIRDTVQSCQSGNDLPVLRRICEQYPSPMGRLLTVALDHLDWSKADNVQALETRARHEISQLERGLVVLEIITGIAPLMGLVGTIYGLISLFAQFGLGGTVGDHSGFAHGIAIALNATLIGLLIAIPSLVAWSYYSKKVENLAVEMETLCQDLLRRLYTK